MRAVLFEGTPEELARVEAVFRAGGDPTMQKSAVPLHCGAGIGQPD